MTRLMYYLECGSCGSDEFDTQEQKNTHTGGYTPNDKIIADCKACGRATAMYNILTFRDRHQLISLF